MSYNTLENYNKISWTKNFEPLTDTISLLSGKTTALADLMRKVHHGGGSDWLGGLGCALSTIESIKYAKTESEGRCNKHTNYLQAGTSLLCAATSATQVLGARVDVGTRGCFSQVGLTAGAFTMAIDSLHKTKLLFAATRLLNTIEEGIDISNGSGVTGQSDKEILNITSTDTEEIKEQARGVKRLSQVTIYATIFNIISSVGLYDGNNSTVKMIAIMVSFLTTAALVGVDLKTMIKNTGEKKYLSNQTLIVNMLTFLSGTLLVGLSVSTEQNVSSEICSILIGAMLIATASIGTLVPLKTEVESEKNDVEYGKANKFVEKIIGEMPKPSVFSKLKNAMGGLYPTRKTDLKTVLLQNGRLPVSTKSFPAQGVS